ncbi:SprB repeat-containing protein [Flavobacteriaceae bacterium MAR_2010_188]|nr:SprB repeat-containing protein [Flavobacteriaceae bacterium MAR_2010_188]
MTTLLLICLFTTKSFGFELGHKLVISDVSQTKAHSFTSNISGLNSLNLTKLLIEHTSEKFKQKLSESIKSISSLWVNKKDSNKSITRPNSKKYELEALGNLSTSASTESVFLLEAKCKSTILQLDSNGLATLLPSDIDDGSTVDSGSPILTISKESFTCDDIGNNMVTLTVTDNNGNSSTCNSTVTVEDNIDPTITAPADTTGTTDSGCVSTNVALGTPTTADNCGVASVTSDAPASFPLGATTVTWTVTDNAGRTATATQTVTVTDNIDPTITSPADTTGTTDSGCGSTNVALGTPTTADNCGVASVTSDAPASFPLGATTVTWTVTDNAGRTATATQTVTVTDNIDPTITAPADTTGTTDSGCVSTNVVLGTPTTADNCGVASVTSDAPASFPLGATTVTWTVTDNAGRTATATQTVTVTDNIDPTITAPADTTGTTDSGCVSTNVALGTPTTADNCGVASVTSDAPASFLLGATTVTWTVTDNAGRTATATQTVTVTDNIDPTITAPADTTGTTDSGCVSTNVVLGTPTTADNCGVASVTSDAPASFPLGATTVTWTVTDNAGRTATATQTVTVTDNIDPTITAPADTTGTTDSGCGSTNVALGTPTTADNCGVASVTSDAPASFPLGATTVTWTVTDNAGRTATATQTVTVTDNIDPTITAPADTTGTTDSGCGSTNVALGTPTTADNCGVASVTSDAPASFPLGATTVTWTVTDNAGRTATATQTVTVTDNIDPTITAPADTTGTTDSGCVSTNVALGTPTTADNCGVASVTSDAPASFLLGATTVTWTVTDNAGRTATATQTVTVTDNIDPTITAPADTTGTTDSGCVSTNVVLGTPTTADNCGVASVTSDAPASFPLGATTVTWTVTDNAGRTATATQTVTVTDNIDPTITAPADTTGTTDSGCGSTNVALGTPTTADNCGVASVTSDAPASFPLGATTVTWTVTDNAGRTATATQTVTVTDNIPPISPTLSNITWGCSYTPSTPTTTDNCSGTINGVANVSFPITSTTTIVWQFTDNHGNSSTANQTITINPLVCNVTIINNVACFGGVDGKATVSAQGGLAPYTYNWNGLDPNSLSAGNHSVTVTDSNGCSSSCNFTITEPSQLIASITNQVNNDCYDGNLGSVTVSGANGTPNYLYSIDGGTFRSSGTFSNLTEGTYAITVRDAKLCTVVQNVTITAPADPVTAIIQITDEGCSSVGTKGVIVTASGGSNSGFQYRRHNGSWGSWTSNGNFGPQPDGDYLFQARDASGCESNIESVKIEFSNPLKLTIPTKQDVLCYGAATGTANSAAVGGLGPYSYSWNTSPVQTTPNATGLAAGTYTLTVTDANNCSVSKNVTITQSTEIQLTENHVNVNCYGKNTGSISLSASGGKPNYTFNINNGAYGSNSNFSNLTAGTYVMGVLDSNGCKKQINVTITQPEILAAAFVLGTNGCSGGSNGTATVNVTGGTAPYSYSWNTSTTQTTATATNLSPGNYICTITDAKGCTLNFPVQYVDPPVLTLTTSTVVTSGAGLSDGKATVSTTGGGGTYTYSWNTSPVQTTATATELTQGNYTVTVTDNLGCTKTASVLVADKIIISPFVEESNYEIGCTEGDSIEQLSLRPEITGGYGTLTYSWNYGANASVISGDSNGGSKIISYGIGGTKTISVTVTDASGQSVTKSFTVIIDTCITFDVDCNKCVANDYTLGEYYIGDENGNPVGTCDNPGEIISSPIYIWFLLNHSDNTNYSLTVVAEYKTTHPITGEIKIETIQDCLYEGEKIGLGKANLFIDTDYVCGSTIEISNFLISWNKLARTPCRQDAPKCLCIADVLTLESPLSGKLAKTDISCFNGTGDGSIDLSLFGGTPPFTYAWSTADGTGLSPSTANQTGLSPGTYTVSVTDSKVTYNETTKSYYSDPQTITLSATIGKPPLLEIASTSSTDVICNGESNGSATVEATGGTPNYTYSWNSSPVQTTQTATNLSAGDYTVTVTDANGCIATETVTVIQPQPLSATITSNEPLCFGDANGNATVNASGGVGTYTYQWNTTPVQTTQTANNLRAGNYTVTVSDSNNCITTANVVIAQPTQLTSTISKTDINCYSADNGTATVTASGGTGAYTYLWNDGSAQTTATASNLAPGTYNVRVTDENGCNSFQNITITQPSELTVSVDFDNPDCYRPISATANASGGTGQFTYSWDSTPVQTTQTATFLQSGNYTVTVTDENGCIATETIDLNIPLLTSANAGADQNLSNSNCGVTTVTLNGSGTDTAGNNYSGTWTIVSGSGGSFADASLKNTTFTGQSGQTYVLRYSISCAQDDVQIRFPIACSKLDFDGTNDYVDFGDNQDFNSNFSIELWMKSEATNTNIQTIYSKRNALSPINGFELRLVNNTLSFRYNLKTVDSPYKISSNRWYHVAVTFDGTTYKLYIDGILANAGNGNFPIANSNKFILGAVDRTLQTPTNYYNGWMDELRIWNKALSVEQIRHMMNQEVEQNSGNVRGAIVPVDIPGLSWSDLSNYYQMKQPSDIVNSYLLDNKGTLNGRLYNITTWQDETAPLPYLTKRNGNWNITNSTTPWLYGDGVWSYPNSIGINNTPIDWNIVKSSHDVRVNSQDVVLLGLLVDSNKIIVTNSGTQDETNQGHGLTVTHYLKLNGIIDLIGESQLVQKRYTPNQVNGSILDAASTGYIKRDQQGTTNLYNYNYWSSPVGTIGSGNNNVPYTVGSILYDGTYSSIPVPVTWNSTYDATGASNPVNLSKRWIYIYENFPSDTYAAWKYISNTGSIPIGLAFTMKGSGVGDPVNDVQNYSFMGKPNNSTINTPISIGNQALVGNPYPSAIDANEFIKDNIPGATGSPDTNGSIDGSLYFWEHYQSNFTHILRDYQGGYAVYNLSGGLPAISPPLVSGEGTSTKIPGQYIPVAQGFFVTASDDGGTVSFKNRQRIFHRESLTNSTFFRVRNPGISDQPSIDDDVRRVRLSFLTPEKATRPLLLSFMGDENATDGFDYGYDALINETDLPNDMSWIIEKNRYVIQGVGSYKVDKQYPLGIFLANSGKISIRLDQLENFDHDDKIYIHDTQTGSYIEINDNTFDIELDAGEYLNRFFVTFQTDKTLSNKEEVLDKSIVLNYLNNSGEIYIKVPNSISIKQVYLINVVGQKVKSWNAFNANLSSETKIPVGKVADGNYIIKIETNGASFNKKILIKQ